MTLIPDIDWQSFAYGATWAFAMIGVFIWLDHYLSVWRCRRNARKHGTPLYLDDNGDLCGDGKPVSGWTPGWPRERAFKLEKRDV